MKQSVKNIRNGPLSMFCTDLRLLFRGHVDILHLFFLVFTQDHFGRIWNSILTEKLRLL